MRIHSHPAVQLLVAVMQEEDDRKKKISNDVNSAIIHELHASFTEEEKRKIQEAANLPLYEYVQELIQILHLDQDESALPYLTAFQDKIYGFIQNRIANATLFLEYWERKKSKYSIAVPATTNAIRIMTIHSSKGLEFDIVHLPDCNEGNIPYKKSTTFEQIEEERRLFYVAITRAKEQVHISFVHGKGDRRHLVSRFLKNVKKSL